MVSHNAMDPKILKLYTLSRLKAPQTLPVQWHILQWCKPSKGLPNPIGVHLGIIQFVGLNCPFSFYKFVVSTSVLLYSGYKMTGQQPNVRWLWSGL